MEYSIRGYRGRLALTSHLLRPHSQDTQTRPQARPGRWPAGCTHLGDLFTPALCPEGSPSLGKKVAWSRGSNTCLRCSHVLACPPRPSLPWEMHLEFLQNLGAFQSVIFPKRVWFPFLFQSPFLWSVNDEHVIPTSAWSL